MTTETAVADDRCIGEIDARADLTAEEFHREYHIPQKPVLLKGHINDWRAMKEWSFDFFKEKYGHWRLPTGRCFDFNELMPLADYCDYVQEHEKAAGHVPDEEPFVYEPFRGIEDDYRYEGDTIDRVLRDYPTHDLAI